MGGIIENGSNFFSNNDCDCIYIDDERLVDVVRQDPLWENYTNDPQNIIPLEKLLQSSLKYKHKAFAAEEEYRLYVRDFFDERFYVRKSELIPYQDIRVPIEALKEIILGPTTNKEKLNFSIRRMLDKASHNILKYHNLEQIEIKSSNIPYITK